MRVRDELGAASPVRLGRFARISPLPQTDRLAKPCLSALHTLVMDAEGASGWRFEHAKNEAESRKEASLPEKSFVEKTDDEGKRFVLQDDRAVLVSEHPVYCSKSAVAAASETVFPVQVNAHAGSHRTD